MGRGGRQEGTGEGQTRPLHDGEKFPGSLCPRLWLHLRVCMDSKAASAGCGGEFTMSLAVTSGTAVTLQGSMGQVKVDSHLSLVPFCSVQAVRTVPPQPRGSSHHWGRN